ncbi:MAG: allantoinase AllB [Bacteroidetes bacterium]|nr:allantoinase AllB [Bacteroidota bacterium]
MKFVIKSRKVLTGGEIRKACILIENGVITDISDYNTVSELEIRDYGEYVIMPSLIDTHVHINEPGREEWEGFESATKSAAAGGVTVLVDMPLNSSPVTTDAEALNKKISSAEGKLYVDTGFYGGAVPGNSGKLAQLFHGGVLGIKSFMIDSGLDEFRPVNENDLEKILNSLKEIPDIPLLVHAEIFCGSEKSRNYSGYSYRSFLESRPKEWENRAIEILIKLSERFSRHIHIVHLSSSDGIDLISEAKSRGVKITTETCPHYLFFSSDKIPDKDTLFKCTPPIRDSENRDKLWKALKDGIIDMVVSDHSPCTEDLKFREEGNFEKAWGGIPGLQTGLSAVWTQASERGFTLKEISKLMSFNPSVLAGLDKKKGSIEKGFDADMIVFDPEEKFTAEGKNLFYKNKFTPYEGEKLKGKVKTTFLRGNIIFDGGKIIQPPSGKILLNKYINQ